MTRFATFLLFVALSGCHAVPAFAQESACRPTEAVLADASADGVIAGVYVVPENRREEIADAAALLAPAAAPHRDTIILVETKGSPYPYLLGVGGKGTICGFVVLSPQMGEAIKQIVVGRAA